MTHRVPRTQRWALPAGVVAACAVLAAVPPNASAASFADTVHAAINVAGNDAPTRSPEPGHPATQLGASQPVALRPNAKEFVVLRRGTRGTRVAQVQRALQRKGYRLIANGKFGPKTHAAVRSFQRKAGLPVTGMVGPKTWRALGLDQPPATTSTTPATTPVQESAYRHPRASVERWHSLALEVGWADRQWRRLSCIINRESGGYPAAHNPSGARGLLQIFYPSHRARVGPDPSVLFDARTNLTIGLALYRASGWRPWGSSTCAS